MANIIYFDPCPHASFRGLTTNIGGAGVEKLEVCLLAICPRQLGLRVVDAAVLTRVIF